MALMKPLLAQIIVLTRSRQLVPSQNMRLSTMVRMIYDCSLSWFLQPVHDDLVSISRFFVFNLIAVIYSIFSG